MNLSTFLSILFDKTTDRYPLIRESLLQSCDVSDIVNILAVTGYHCSQKELKRYIKYNCIDKGATVVSMGTPRWIFPVHKTVNAKYYTDIHDNIRKQYFKWMDIVMSVNGPMTAVFGATSSNSQFYFSFTASSNIYYIPPHFITVRGHLKCAYSIQSKVNNSRVLEDIYSQKQDDTIDLPTTPEDMYLHTQKINTIICEFCKYMQMDVFRFAELFRREMIIEDSWRYDNETSEFINYEF